MQTYGIFGGFPLNSALFGLVMTPVDKKTWQELQKQFTEKQQPFLDARSGGFSR